MTPHPYIGFLILDVMNQFMFGHELHFYHVYKINVLTYPLFSSSTGSLALSVCSIGLDLGSILAGADETRLSMNTPLTCKRGNF